MPEFNPLITLYKNVNALQPPIGNVPFLDVINDIRSGKYTKLVVSLQGLSQEEYDKQKKSLPAATFSGTFKPIEIQTGKNKGKLSYRTIEGLDQYSHIVLIDVDKLSPEDIILYGDLLRQNPYVLAFFISPSRKGLKILFRESTGNHTAAWAAINHYLTKAYGIPVDESGKDVCRLCFVSDHANLHYNPDCDVVDALFVTEHTPPPPPAAKPKASVKAAASGQKPDLTDLAGQLAKCHEITQKTTPIPQGGGYNKYTNVFALQANRYGISEADCWAELESFFPFAAYLDQRPVVTSVYGKFGGEHGKWKPELSMRSQNATASQSKRNTASTPKMPATVAPGANGRYDESVLFWYSITKKDRQGNVSEDYKLSFDDTIVFLENNGFYKYQLRGDAYQLIRLDKAANIVDIVNELRVKEFILSYLKSQPTPDFKEVRELFRRSKTICSVHNLEGLEYYHPLLRRDTAKTASLYFTNCFLEISADGVTTKPYSDLHGQCLWKKHVRDFEYHHYEWDGCDASEFLSRALTGKKGAHSELSELDKKKVLSGHTTIGYLLHSYKDPTVSKAVLAVDQVLRRDKENEGRSGKSLLAKMIERVINVITLDGRNFSLDKSFALQKINPDTRLVNLNDAKKSLDFTRFFGMITEDLDYEKKNQDILTMSYEDSPKWYISMNSSMRGDGSSARDRQHVIEFTNYYNDKHKPVHEFGRQFFNEWDEKEWQRFYSFMVHCLQSYLQHGLVDFPLENYGMNKLIDRAGEDFVDYMDDNVLATLDVKKEHIATDLYNGYAKDISEKFRPKINEFTARVKMWVEANNLILNPRTKGERDRRNSITYLTFARINDSLPGTVTEVTEDPDAPLPF